MTPATRSEDKCTGSCGRIHWNPLWYHRWPLCPTWKVFSTGVPSPDPSPPLGEGTGWGQRLWLGRVTHSFSTQDSEGPVGRSRCQFLRLADGGQSCIIFQVLLRSRLWVPPMELIKMQSSQACAPETLTCEAQVALGIALFRSPSAHPA